MKKPGFTLIEILLAIAIIVLLAALSVPFYTSTLVSTQSKDTTIEIVQSLRRAKIKALAAVADDNWGVAVGRDDKITLFKGSSYVSRDQNLDEAFALPPSITSFDGLSEIIFLKSTGNPNTIGDITFIDSNNQSHKISINPEGTIDF